MIIENGNLPIILCKEEPFFISPEGEGIKMGTLMSWSRLSSCNLNCSWKDNEDKATICDSWFTSWAPTKVRSTVQEVFDFHYNANANWASISGGEPTNQENIKYVIDALETHGKRVKYETNGTKFIPTMASCVCVSPKLKSSFSGFDVLISKETDPDKIAVLENRKQIQINERYKPEELKKILDYHKENVCFKFVVNTEDDLEEIINDYVKPLNIPSNLVYLMPQGIDQQEINEKAQWIIEKCCKPNRFNFSHRLHIMIYGSKVGV